ncbi:MAG: methylated-DNA--[protein]-cysteine S-methyltransferase [Verrucomicrobiota bacterium]|nr:methylated-DNA--[protein]-cysteine S-methyltransferase [Verrucomicrobiota bacterium]
MEKAREARDASYDGLFFIAVKTTGIFCRPSCPARPKRANIEFFTAIGDAVSAGYRPCKRCRPDLANGKPPEWVEQLIERVNASPDVRLRAADLRAMQIAPERARRWFQQNYGMTFSDWARGLRLSSAFTQLRNGEPKEDVMLGNGFQSHSGFNAALARTFTEPTDDCIRMTMLETPLGPMVAAANDEGVCLLEFADRRGLDASYEKMRKIFRVPVLPGEKDALKKLRAELAAYFAGTLRRFTVPLFVRGTEFQKKVWRELKKIPHGETVSYEQIAERVGNYRAVRAVARANGTNRISIIIPCHRVIGKDGGLSGYGGGVWRKRLLLDLERKSAKA